MLTRKRYSGNHEEFLAQCEINIFKIKKLDKGFVVPLDYFEHLTNFKGKDWIEVKLDQEQIYNSGAYSLLSYAEDELDIEIVIRQIEEAANKKAEKLEEERRLEHSRRKQEILKLYSADIQRVRSEPTAEQKRAYVNERVQRATLRRLREEKKSLWTQKDRDAQDVEDVFLRNSLALAIMAAVRPKPVEPNAQQLEELEFGEDKVDEKLKFREL